MRAGRFGNHGHKTAINQIYHLAVLPIGSQDRQDALLPASVGLFAGGLPGLFGNPDEQT